MTRSKSFASKTVSLVSIAVLLAEMSTLFIASNALAVDDDNEFGICARELLKVGISEEQAAAACADALVPSDLSSCVQNISTETPIKSEDALRACYRVRRPVELADCMINIDTNVTLEESDSLLALDSCRRSLLPERYSECVVGLSEGIENISLQTALETCITAEAYPTELLFEPAEQ